MPKYRYQASLVLYCAHSCLKNFFNYFIGGQEKIVRAFAEVMKNMARMKACVRPAMCKPYGKQSEALQKSNKIHNIYHDLCFNIFSLDLQVNFPYKLIIFYIILY